MINAPIFSFAMHTAFIDEGIIKVGLKQLDIVKGLLSDQQQLSMFPLKFSMEMAFKDESSVTKEKISDTMQSSGSKELDFVNDLAMLREEYVDTVDTKAADASSTDFGSEWGESCMLLIKNDKDTDIVKPQKGRFLTRFYDVLCAYRYLARNYGCKTV